MKVSKTQTFAQRSDDFARINPAGLSVDEAWERTKDGWWIPDIALSDQEYEIYESLCDDLKAEFFE